MGERKSWCVDSGIYIYIYIYISLDIDVYIYIYIFTFVPPRGGFMESGTQPTRPNFPCLRILYEASTVGTECAPSMWPLVTPLAWE